jgi:hypothetical protein
MLPLCKQEAGGSAVRKRKAEAAGSVCNHPNPNHNPCAGWRCRARAQVRHVGVSNETSYGVMRFCQLAEQLGLPKIVSIQNSYSLLARPGLQRRSPASARWQLSPRQCAKCLFAVPCVTVRHLRCAAGVACTRAAPNPTLTLCKGARRCARLSRRTCPRCARRGSATWACSRTARWPAARCRASTCRAARGTRRPASTSSPATWSGARARAGARPAGFTALPSRRPVPAPVRRPGRMERRARALAPARRACGVARSNLALAAAGNACGRAAPGMLRLHRAPPRAPPCRGPHPPAAPRQV